METKYHYNASNVFKCHSGVKEFIFDTKEKNLTVMVLVYIPPHYLVLKSAAT